MELIPAIDLMGGRVVRLSGGAFDAITDYAHEPVAVARRWESEGARRIHIVDLDAAREGRAVQAKVIEGIVRSLEIPCQVAGGIRDADAARALLDVGADRVVLGSALVSDPGLARTLLDSHGPERIVAALDVRDGQALGDGWVEGARGTEALGLATTLAKYGIRWFVVTAVARDGGLAGPDFQLLASVRACLAGASIIASGGIGSLGDIRALAAQGYEAAITGRALYEGTFTLPDALANAV